MASHPFQRALSALLVFTLLLESVAFAGTGTPRRVPTLNELDAFQKQARLEEERLQALANERAAEESQRASATHILRTHLFTTLPADETARQTLLSRQESLGKALNAANDGTRRMTFRLLGQNLAALLHHPERVAHLRRGDPSALETPVSGPGPFRTPGERSSTSTLDGAAVDTRAEQTASAALLQNAIASRPTPWTSGFLGRFKAGWAQRLLLSGLLGASITILVAAAGGATDAYPGHIADWETGVTYEMAGSGLIAHSNPDSPSLRFGSEIGGYEAAWNTAIGNAPHWARPSLQSRVFGSNDFQRLRELETEIHGLHAAGAPDASIRELRQEAHQLHLNIAINIRQWLGWSEESSNSVAHNIDWSAEGEAALATAGETASALNHWYVSLFGYVFGFGFLAFSLFSAANLARVAVDNGRKRGQAHAQEKRYLEKLAEGYEEGCAQIGITPAAKITAALRSGNMDMSLALLPPAAEGPLCETFLSPFDALANLEARPVVHARVEVTESSDDENTTAEAEAIEEGPTRRRSRSSRTR